jgi:peptidoglycan/LPS O-acetylase OafA/YrhL
LRFCCFLLVFFFHSFYSEKKDLLESPVYRFVKIGIFGNGNIGVNVFFVLSGFLITYLLLQEKEEKGKINVPYFWLRRILRIWPLYFLCVFFGFVIFPLLKIYFGGTPNETATFFHYWTFTSNFEIIRKGLPDSSILGVLWSVAIEEQFYFFWPLLLALVPRRYFPWLFSFFIVGSLLFRGLHPSALLYELHTFSCIADMVIGALGAYLIATHASFLHHIQNLSRAYIVLIYMAFAFILFCRQALFFQNHWVAIFERSFVATVILGVVLEQNYSTNSFFKFAKFKTMSKLGVISYGLYCLHFIGILVALTVTKFLHLNESLWEVLILETFISLGFTILLANLSYHFMERHFLKLKDRFAFIVR